MRLTHTVLEEVVLEWQYDQPLHPCNLIILVTYLFYLITLLRVYNFKSFLYLLVVFKAGFYKHVRLFFTLFLELGIIQGKELFKARSIIK